MDCSQRRACARGATGGSGVGIVPVFSRNSEVSVSQLQTVQKSGTPSDRDSAFDAPRPSFSKVTRLLTAGSISLTPQDRARLRSRGPSASEAGGFIPANFLLVYHQRLRT